MIVATPTSSLTDRKIVPIPELINIRGLSKAYSNGKQTVEILRSLDFDVAAGEFVALMGPSGSGKTTLLNLVAGLDAPTSGSVSVCGERVDRLTPGALARWRADKIGFVFQLYHLMPMLSAHRNVELPLLLTKLGRIERKRRARVALELVGLGEHEGRLPGELSGGQQQRVAIARAIVSDPELIVCDEPTGNLDREAAEEVMSLLSVLNCEHGKTILMVTHDPKAARHAQRTQYLDKGSLLTVAVPA